MNNEQKRKLREKCCEEHSDIIRGRRLTDLESKIFNNWGDIFEEPTDELLEFLKEYKKK